MGAAKPTRRRAIAGAAAALAGIAVVRAPARAATFQYKLAYDQPQSHPIGVYANAFKQAVERETNGRLQIQVFPNGVLGSDTSLTAQLRSGALEMNLQSESGLSTVSPLAGIDRLGFVFPQRTDALAALDGDLGKLIRNDLASKGILTLERSWEAGYRQVTTANRVVRNVDDLAGLKIRVPAGIISTDLFRSLGASPTAMSSTEMYMGLQTHIVDAWEGPYINIDSNRIYEVQKYLCITNHQWTAYWFTINPGAWNALPPDIQAIVTKHGNAYALQERRSADLLNHSLIDKLARIGMKVNTTDEASFRKPLGPYYAHWKSEFGATAWSTLEKYSGKLV